MSKHSMFAPGAGLVLESLACLTDEECAAIIGGDGNGEGGNVTVIEFTEDEVETIEVPAPPPICRAETSTTT